MTMLFFLDTNILLYSRDLNAPEKRARAVEWLRELSRREQIVINLQVLNEFRHVALRKFQFLDPVAVRSESEAMSVWGARPIDEDQIESAWAIRDSYRYSWFDCLLLAAADRLDCTHFLSEDLQHGQSVGTVTILNPFLVRPDELLTG